MSAQSELLLRMEDFDICREEALRNLEKSPTYANSVILHMLRAQSAHPFLGTDSAMIVTDYDKTLSMNRPGDGSDTQVVVDYATNLNIPLAVVTGSDYDMMTGPQGKLVRFGTPTFLPAILATDGGSEPHVLQLDGSYIPDGDFETMLKETTGFDYMTTYSACIAAMEQINREFPGIGMHFQQLYDIPNIQHHKPDVGAALVDYAQPDDFQPTTTVPGNYKISFHFLVPPSDEAAVAAVSARMTEIMHETNPNLRTSSSSAHERRNGLDVTNFDVLAADKNDFALYLGKIFNGVVKATFGDSGNDIALLGADHPTYAMRGAVGGYEQRLVGSFGEMNHDCPPNNLMQFGVNGNLYYIERDETRKGPASMLHALKLARRLHRIARQVRS